MKKILIYTAALLSLASCTVTKRIHNSGFHIQWNAHHTSINTFNKTNLDPSNEVEKTSVNVEETEEIKNESSPLIKTSNEKILASTIEKNCNKIFSSSPSKMIVSEKLETEKHLKSKTENKIVETKKHTSDSNKKDRKVSINWETVGFFALLLLLATIWLIAYFGTGLIAQISVVIIAIVSIVLVCIAVYYMFYFLWQLLFGWMM